MFIIIDTINAKDFETFKRALDIYKQYLGRDYNLGEYLDRIAKYYFDGATIKQKNMMAAMMQSMMSGGGPMAMMNPMGMMAGRWSFKFNQKYIS